MKVFSLLLVGAALLMAGCSAKQDQIHKVTVRDSDFEVVQVLKGEEELAVFCSHWNKRKEVEPQEQPDFSYKVDIETDDGSTRWLYDPAGYVRVLNVKVNPTYRFENPEQVKAFLLPRSESLATFKVESVQLPWLMSQSFNATASARLTLMGPDLCEFPGERTFQLDYSVWGDSGCGPHPDLKKGQKITVNVYGPLVESWFVNGTVQPVWW